MFGVLGISGKKGGGEFKGKRSDTKYQKQLNEKMLRGRGGGGKEALWMWLERQVMVPHKSVWGPLTKLKSSKAWYIDSPKQPEFRNFTHGWGMSPEFQIVRGGVSNTYVSAHALDHHVKEVLAAILTVVRAFRVSLDKHLTFGGRISDPCMTGSLAHPLC